MERVRYHSEEGAYGFQYAIELLKSRRGIYYVERTAFEWDGNSGGSVTRRYRLTEEGAAYLNRLWDRFEEAKQYGGLLCPTGKHATDPDHSCEKCEALAFVDVFDSLRDEDFYSRV